MTTIDIYSIHTSDLPEGAKLRRIKGDWMEDGYINNLGRPRRLEIVVIDGKGWVVNAYGYLHDSGETTPVVLDADGAIPLGAGWSFLPDAGELERVGL